MKRLNDHDMVAISGGQIETCDIIGPANAVATAALTFVFISNPIGWMTAGIAIGAAIHCTIGNA